MPLKEITELELDFWSRAFISLTTKLVDRESTMHQSQLWKRRMEMASDIADAMLDYYETMRDSHKIVMPDPLEIRDCDS